MKTAIKKNAPGYRGRPELWTLIAASFLFALFLLYGYSNFQVQDEESAPQTNLAPAARQPAPAEPAVSDSEDQMRYSVGRIRKNDNFYDILTAQGATPRAIYEMGSASRKVFNLSKIKIGHAYRLGFNKTGELTYLEYEIDDNRLVRVQKKGDSLKAETAVIDYDIREVAMAATIDRSLYLTLTEMGESPMLAIELSEIFAWNVDFNTDIRKGDKFSLVLEKKYRDGVYVLNGRIFGAEFVSRGRAYKAVYFEGSSGRGDYFSEEGKSLRNQFLKAPLRYSRISSGYSLRRLHPVLKKFRPHQGIDYAAPRGTPVVAVGDGKVTWAGRKGWNGVFVKLKHTGTYTSSYGHLQRLAKGIKRGVRVQQGQVIGYVGSTGMATGPHLDFRIRKNGEYINPLKLKTPVARSVAAKDFKAFAIRRDELVSRLKSAGGVMSAKRENGATN